MANANEIIMRLKSVSPFSATFMYLDVGDKNFAMREFIKKNLSVNIVGVYSHPDSKYNIIICNIKKSRIQDFIDAIQELSKNMMLYGYTDYYEHAKDFMSRMREEDN